jgi:hypothetical protein
MKNVGKRLAQPPSSPAEGAGAPRNTLSTVAHRVIATGSPSATTYHTGATRHRTIRLNKPSIPALPWVMASTISAAKKGPKLATAGRP